jgi:lysophospholipase L1-like esterase
VKEMNPIIKFYQRTIENVFTHLNAVAKPGSIVFLGDSITDFFRLNEFFPEVYVINRGISGDTTDGVLRRLPESIYELSPSKVFLMIGTNDLANKKSVEYISENIKKIISEIKENSPQTKIYLQSVYPVSLLKDKKIKRFIVGKRNNDDISRLNSILKTMADEMEITYIDVYNHLVDESGNIKTEYTVEGLHLTIQGYSVVAGVLRPYIY